MTNYRMHPDEILITKDLVKQLIKEQFPQWADLSIDPVNSTGTDNAIFRLGKDMAIRLPRTPSAARNINKEYEWLPRLALYSPLKIPIAIALGSPVNEYLYPWYVYHWIEGVNATQMHIDLSKAAFSLGNFVLNLQKTDTINAPLSQRDGPLSAFDEEVQDALHLLDGMIDVAAAAKAWKKALDISTYAGTPLWIHADLHPSNMIVNNNEISAIIDFGMAGIGDPACDLMPAWTILSAESRTIFREIVNADDETWERGKGYALSFGLIALPYYKNTNPVLANIALRTINEVLLANES